MCAARGCALIKRASPEHTPFRRSCKCPPERVCGLGPPAVRFPGRSRRVRLAGIVRRNGLRVELDRPELWIRYLDAPAAWRQTAQPFAGSDPAKAIARTSQPSSASSSATTSGGNVA